ncbi:hypothetical protein ACJ2CR_04390 [Myxococcus faecalis]|uniref:hypothetical protein n=1 Tax=Myxococcus faecalis TaxID=3115646 RepID=UPI0038D0D54E
MTIPIRAVFSSLSCALLLSACGPEYEGDVGDPSRSEDVSPDVEEPGEDGSVSQATFGGHLGSALGHIASFDSCAANNEWRTTCGTGAARDMSYTWTVPVTGDYSITTYGSSYDTILEVRRAADTGVVYACNDDWADGNYRSRVVLRDQPKGRKLFIIVDGYSGDCGAGRLYINGL